MKSLAIVMSSLILSTTATQYVSREIIDRGADEVVIKTQGSNFLSEWNAAISAQLVEWGIPWWG